MGSREHLFPATSVGRSQGSVLQRVGSNDSMAAHPLLSSNHSFSPTNDRSSPTTSNTRYVPYTPRQRVNPTAATTGTTVHPSSPQHQQGDATSKLQLVNLKAAAQNIGLDAGSIGWAILEKLVHVSDHHDAEWTEIWTAVTSGKSTLLLPREHSNQDKPTPEFVKDHIILSDELSRKDAPIVTLSGLRGTLTNNTLTFRSTIHPSSKIFQDLLVPSSRSLALAILPDLPVTPSSSSSSISYPTFSIHSHSPALPLPPRIPSSLPNKPPLPPRPGNRVISTSSAASSTSRIANPFASLFGSGSSPKPPTAVPSSPTASLLSLDSANAQPEPVLDVSAFTIERKIVRKDIAKEMNKTLRREVKEALGEAGLPGWAVDRVHEFTAEWYPFVKEKGVSSSVLGLREKAAKESGAGTYVVTWAEEAPDSAAARVQDFYLALEQDLRVSEGSFLGRLRKDHENEEGSRNGVDDDRRVREKVDSETKIKEAMDVVERGICSLFYDRLYMQPTSDDSSHDEALSSRVAALNMLDLGLEHLDIHADQAGPELDAVVKACGDILSQLQVCRSPGDKAAVLVAAHKIVVDGLSRLPPIRLMSEEESKAQKAKGSAIARAKAEAPPRESRKQLPFLVMCYFRWSSLP
ncbi:hypothetical protein DXG03_003607 [Asterophora parasitica]|uniref:VPS9 domain-containing protein n=1 Tax=Asterophora parasitica TaxID=117018 RepID=A0A9P7G4T6_9AGAR|nr:hypothetical protein DXG03_003607 [Asterophora parasitica]